MHQSAFILPQNYALECARLEDGEDFNRQLLVTAQSKSSRDHDALHANAFPGLRDRYRDTALELDLAALQAETAIDGRLSSFIAEVMGWLAERGSIEAISRTIELRERDLKDSRAFLLNEKRRRDWRKSVAEPLDYRWPVVRRMIESVRAVS